MAMAPKPGFNIRDAAMIDIAIGPGQTPASGVSAEIGGHVLMHMLLEVELEGVAIGADNDVDTDAAIFRDVAAGIFKGDIGWIVKRGDADLCSRTQDQI